MRLELVIVEILVTEGEADAVISDLERHGHVLTVDRIDQPQT